MFINCIVIYPASLSVILVSVVLFNLVPVLNNMSITRAAVRRQNMQAQVTNKQRRGDYSMTRSKAIRKKPLLDLQFPMKTNMVDMYSL